MSKPAHDDSTHPSEPLTALGRPVPTGRLSRMMRTARGAFGLTRQVFHRDDFDPEAVRAVVGQLGELKGVAMKAGQILSYIDPSLPPELRAALAVLQNAAPKSPWAEVERTLRTELGDRADTLLAHLEREPRAVASIAQVHRAELPGVGPVAVKVRHVGIEAALRADFSMASSGSSIARALVPGAGVTVAESVGEARAAMLEECDLALEARRQQRFSDLFRGHPTLVIPDVQPTWSTSAVMTTRWCAGLGLDQLLSTDPPRALRDRYGVALFELYVGTLYRHGLFHADPHPGNYAFLGDERVAVYDFGCVRTFDAPTLTSFRALARATREDDRDAIVRSLVELGARPPKDAAGRERRRDLARGFFGPLTTPGARPMAADASLAAGTLLRDKRAMMELALPGKLLFLLRLRFGLYAVLARLGAVADWSELEASYAIGAPCAATRVPSSA
ncbi:MAG: AarF/ABC1/UbiB kinase family protein [Polyangiaceae bacterium]